MDATTATTRPKTGTAMTPEEREAFDRDGYLLVPGVLSSDEVATYVSVIDGLYQRHQEAGRLGANGSLHELSAVATCTELAPLLDHPGVLGYIWSVLGWNVHVYHSHIDVHPPVAGEVPFRFEWHQDGGRQNREIESDPRPRMSIKTAWWLSDVSETGRGNFQLVPGSHRANRIDGPPKRDVEWPDPEGAMQVTAHPGDVVIFDRRIWHARSINRSTITRKACFFGYTYRWVQSRDDLPTDDGRFTPVERQFVGLMEDVDGDHAWGHYPERLPLYEMLREAGLLDPTVDALRP